MQVVVMIVAVVVVAVVGVGEAEIGAAVGVVVVVALGPCVEVGEQFLKEFGKIGFVVVVDAAKVRSASVRLVVKIPLAVDWVMCGPVVAAAFAAHCVGEVAADERFAWAAVAEEVPA